MLLFYLNQKVSTFAVIDFDSRDLLCVQFSVPKYVARVSRAFTDQVLPFADISSGPVLARWRDIKRPPMLML